MTTAPTVGHRRPLTGLAKAEYLQFRRNKTLVFVGTVFPVGIPLLTFFAGRSDGDPMHTLVATLEMFAIVALLFVQYYSVLSMVTTRRGEGVLKRLRTGEATDWQILTAPAVPGVLLTIAGAAIVTGFVYGTGAPVPVNPIAMVVALFGGLVVFSLLALATSGVTKNAEAAQITALPVMAIAMVGMSSIRSVLPDRVAVLADWTPFAAVSDLVSLGVTGTVASAAESIPTMDINDTFVGFGVPLAVLAAWAVLALGLVYKTFRWDERG
ncbi:ABC transporter permease [Rhodococcus sp. NPDC049939]|uniref:ABC transporter permease n=1 Tax=Rhodococcus sp. NPDC049939 TaxID=3155511 RepID=UPI0033DEF290